MADEEVPLLGGWVTAGVVRVGDTVRRPPGPNSGLVREVLEVLDAVGFDAAPRFLGYDERGRETLTYIEGDVPSDTREIVFADEQLAASARLLRRYHDAIAGSEPAAGQEVVCHHDYGPWNLIWRDGLPVGIIDWDNVAGGRRVDDLGYAVWKHLNLGLLDLPLDEQRRRLAVFLDGYGQRPAGLLEAIGHAQRLLAEDDAERRWLAADGAGLIS